MRSILCYLILLCSTTLYSQRTQTQVLNSNLFKNDSVYQVDIQHRIKYLAKLDKIVLSKYFPLQQRIQSEFEKSDLSLLDSIFSIYESNRNRVFKEMRATQKNSYFNLLTYSRINNMLLEEGILSYPDSYGFLVNDSYPQSLGSSKFLINIKEILKQFEEVLTENRSEISSLDCELRQLQKTSNIPRFLNNNLDSDIEAKKICSNLNLIFWAYKDFR